MVVKTLAFRWHDVTESDRLGSKTPSECRSNHHFLGITANALGPSEQHLLFFGRNRWVALSQGFNVMLLWDKGGFKYGICKQRSNQGGIKRVNLIFDCSILVIFIQYSNLIWSTLLTTLYHWHEQMMSANLTGNARPKRSHTCWNRASHFGEKTNCKLIHVRSCKYPWTTWFPTNTNIKTKTWFFGTDLRTHSKNN